MPKFLDDITIEKDNVGLSYIADAVVTPSTRLTSQPWLHPGRYPLLKSGNNTKTQWSLLPNVALIRLSQTAASVQLYIATIVVEDKSGLLIGGSPNAAYFFNYLNSMGCTSQEYAYPVSGRSIDGPIYAVSTAGMQTFRFWFASSNNYIEKTASDLNFSYSTLLTYSELIS